MEVKAQAQNQSQSGMNNNRNNMKRSSSSNSDMHTNPDSPHSPLRFHSPLRSDQGDPDPLGSPLYSSPYPSPQKSPKNPTPQKQQQQNNSKAIVAVPDKFPRVSPAAIPVPPPPPTNTGMMLNRAVMGEGTQSMTKVGPGGEGRSGSAILKRSRTEESVKVANLGFRLSEIVLCLISFSVMAADKTQGWSGDSYDLYREYRYCLSINVIGFVYSAFQAYDLGYYISTGKHVIRHHLKRPFDFFMDQVLAYLLISAASAAATRVDDWQSNWGKDDFTIMASASIAMAFLAFAAFALSSLISGYNLCTTDAM